MSSVKAWAILVSLIVVTLLLGAGALFYEAGQFKEAEASEAPVSAFFRQVFIMLVTIFFVGGALLFLVSIARWMKSKNAQ